MMSSLRTAAMTVKGKCEKLGTKPNGKSKKVRKKSKKDTLAKEDEHLVGRNRETDHEEANCISFVDEDCSKEIKRKSKKDRKKIEKGRLSKEVEHVVGNNKEADQDEVYCISSGDEDCSRGMKKLLTLQSKFEEDKKRIQQMRAARKFRPY